MNRREPMAPVQGLKKPTLPPPTPRPRTLASVPSPVPDPAEPLAEESATAEEGMAVAAPAQRSEQPGDTEAQKATRPKRSRAEKTSTSTRSASANADTMKPVSVSVPRTLADAWSDRAKKDRASQVDVLLDAIVAHQGELDELLAASTEKPTVSDGLFDRGPATKRERHVGVSLRIKARNLEVIDRLAEKHGPVKRSPFVAAVLTAYLA